MQTLISYLTKFRLSKQLKDLSKLLYKFNLCVIQKYDIKSLVSINLLTVLNFQVCNIFIVFLNNKKYTNFVDL